MGRGHREELRYGERTQRGAEAQLAGDEEWSRKILT